MKQNIGVGPAIGICVVVALLLGFFLFKRSFAKGGNSSNPYSNGAPAGMKQGQGPPGTTSGGSSGGPMGGGGPGFGGSGGGMPGGR